MLGLKSPSVMMRLGPRSLGFYYKIVVMIKWDIVGCLERLEERMG